MNHPKILKKKEKRNWNEKEKGEIYNVKHRLNLTDEGKQLFYVMANVPAIYRSRGNIYIFRLIIEKFSRFAIFILLPTQKINR
jgi:DNA-binding MarR family transcriptional regulator